MSDGMNSTNSDAEIPSPAPWAVAGSVLDGGTELPESVSSTVEEKQRLADHFWLDALLKQLLGRPDEQRREMLIQKIRQAMRDDATARSSETDPLAAPVSRRSRPTRRVWMTSAASLAAMLLVGAVLFWPEGVPGTALAAVERSLLVASADVDREYRVQITQANSQLVPSGTLTVRGAGQYVFAQPGPIGVLRVGSNGKEYWLVPPVGPIHAAPEGSLIERLLSERQVSTPILNLATILEQLRDRYDLELLAEEQIPSHDDAGRLVRCQHLLGRLRNESELLAPRAIEVWCDRSTGAVQRMTLGWPAGSRSGMLQCDVRLQPPVTDLPANFYDHSGHHSAQRQVIPLPPPFRAPPERLKLPLPR